MPMTLPVWLVGCGGAVVGSGKLGRPCVRMHFASLSSSSFRLSDNDPGPLPLGSSLAHVFWADRNAGACGLIQLGMTLGPPGLGSGKFGTPCERMHSACLSAGPPLSAALLDLPEDPQAAIARPQLTAISAIETLWGRPLPVVEIGMRRECFGRVSSSEGRLREPKAP